MLSSERLKNFIGTHWNPTSADLAQDIDAVIEHLKNNSKSGYSIWLKADYKRAVENHEFEPDELHKLTGIRFYEQYDVDNWVHRMWTTYFPEDLYPGKVLEPKRKTSLASERLESFIAAWCDVDGDISEVTNILRDHPKSGWALWLKDDLGQAIENKELKPEELEVLTNIAFDNQAEVDKWLRGIWTEWFPGYPYPG